jgi:hypothetical protein
MKMIFGREFFLSVAPFEQDVAPAKASAGRAAKGSASTGFR